MGIIGGDCCLYWIAYRFGESITKLPVIGKHRNPAAGEARGGFVPQIWDLDGRGGANACGHSRGDGVIAAGTSRFKFTLSF